jgi:hypothetical protein
MASRRGKGKRSHRVGAMAGLPALSLATHNVSLGVKRVLPAIG